VASRRTLTEEWLYDYLPQYGYDVRHIMAASFKATFVSCLVVGVVGDLHLSPAYARKKRRQKHGMVWTLMRVQLMS